MKKAPLIKPSKDFLDALDAAPISRIKIAETVGIRPQTFALLLCGAMSVKEDDERIIEVGKFLGLDAEECFEYKRRA